MEKADNKENYVVVFNILNLLKTTIPRKKVCF